MKEKLKLVISKVNSKYLLVAIILVVLLIFYRPQLDKLISDIASDKLLVNSIVGAIIAYVTYKSKSNIDK